MYNINSNYNYLASLIYSNILKSIFKKYSSKMKNTENKYWKEKCQRKFEEKEEAFIIILKIWEINKKGISKMIIWINYVIFIRLNSM